MKSTSGGFEQKEKEVAGLGRQWGHDYGSNGGDNGTRGREEDVAEVFYSARGVRVGGCYDFARRRVVRTVEGTELVLPGVISDSDYRMCLSTGIKFTDTHMATVLDSSRVLLDEIAVLGDGGGGLDGGVMSVSLLST